MIEWNEIKLNKQEVLRLTEFQCKSCGASLEMAKVGDIHIECLYCGTTTDISQIKDSSLGRGFLLLGKSDWLKATSAFEQAIKEAPENVVAHVGLLLAAVRVKHEDELMNHNEPLVNDASYRQAIQFANDALRMRLESYNKAILERLEAERVAMEKAQVIQRRKRKRNMIVLAVIAVLVVVGYLAFEAVQERAEERRLIAEQEAQAQAEIEAAEAERQAVVDFIEERIAIGYDSWTELMEWADEGDIPWYLYSNGEQLDDDLIELINRYGISGHYLGAEVGIEFAEVMLVLNFADLTYQEVVAELAQINKSSEADLNGWLESGGLERLEQAFSEVTVLDVQRNGNRMIGEPEFGKEFIRWSFASEPWISNEDSFLRIERLYEVLLPSRELIHEMVLERLDAFDRTEYLLAPEIRRGQTWPERVMSRLGIAEEWLDQDPAVISMTVLSLASNGEPLASRNRRYATEEYLTNWEFTYSYINDGQTLEIEIQKTFDLNPDQPGISRANFELIENGMAVDDVNTLLGREGRLASSSEGVSIYTWQQTFGGDTGLVVISVTFENGLATGKTQEGW